MTGVFTSAGAPPALGRSDQRLSPQDWLTLSLSSIGGALEFFDFTVFIFFTPVIGQLFFPADQPQWIKELQSLSVFALGYFARPVGGAIIAHYGDRIGRKGLFMLTIFLMGAPTLLIGFLPTYQTIGIWAPILLLVLRLIQGLGIAGEVPGSVVFVTEHLGRARAGFAGAVIFGMLYFGLFLGSLSALLLTRYLTPEQLNTWGWRLPFIVGGVLALGAVYLRRYLSETPLFKRIHAQRRISSALPVKVVLTEYLPSCLFVIVLAALLSTIATGIFQYLATPLQTLFKFPRDTVFQANAAATLILAICGPLWGKFGDKIGLHRAFAIGGVLTLIAVVWFFYRLEQLPPDGSGLLLSWVILALPGSFICIVPSLAALAFPTSVRYTGFAVPYNVGAAFIAGLVPIFLTFANQFFGRSSGAALVGVGVIMALASVPFMPGLFAKAERDEVA